MANNNASQSQPNAGADKSNQEKIKETLKQAKYNPAVKEALKKENQPPSAGAAIKSLSNLDIQSDSVKQFIQFLVNKKISITS